MLDMFIENAGRVNYGNLLESRKGVCGCACHVSVI